MVEVVADKSVKGARAGVAMITHTTYLGHSQMLGAAAFLDRVMPPQILFRFNHEKPQKIPWTDYEKWLF